jgi:hypothetical protein
VYKRQQRRDDQQVFELPLGQQSLAALDSYFQAWHSADWKAWVACLCLLLGDRFTCCLRSSKPPSHRHH